MVDSKQGITAASEHNDSTMSPPFTSETWTYRGLIMDTSWKYLEFDIVLRIAFTEATLYSAVFSK